MPNSVMYVAMPPNTASTTVTATRSVNVKAHRSIAILEFISMTIILLLEIIYLVPKSDDPKMGTGVWFAVFIGITGLLGYLGAVKNGRCLIIGCMVMAIITTCLSFVALSFYAAELSTINNRLSDMGLYYFEICYSCGKYNQIKNSVGIIGLLFTCVLTIVQASFCCKGVCDCCKNASQSGAIVQPPQQSTIVIHQQQTAPVPPVDSAAYGRWLSKSTDVSSSASTSVSYTASTILSSTGLCRVSTTSGTTGLFYAANTTIRTTNGSTQLSASHSTTSAILKYSMFVLCTLRQQIAIWKYHIRLLSFMIYIIVLHTEL